jgi:AcrR family transcriptional regulator
MSPRPARAVRRRKPLDRDVIADAALKLIDRHGEAALSARRLAAACGCEAMSLYHHVPGMAEVRDEVVDRLLGRLPLPVAGTADPGAELRKLAAAYRELIIAHPRLAPLVAEFPLRLPATQRLVMALQAWGVAAGLAPRDAVRYTRALGAYMMGAMSAELHWRENCSLAVLDAPLREKLEQTGIDERAFRPEEIAADLAAGFEALLAGMLARAGRSAAG